MSDDGTVLDATMFDELDMGRLAGLHARDNFEETPMGISVQIDVS